MDRHANRPSIETTHATRNGQTTLGARSSLRSLLSRFSRADDIDSTVPTSELQTYSAVVPIGLLLRGLHSSYQYLHHMCMRILECSAITDIPLPGDVNSAIVNARSVTIVLVLAQQSKKVELEVNRHFFDSSLAVKTNYPQTLNFTILFT